MPVFYLTLFDLAVIFVSITVLLSVPRCLEIPTDTALYLLLDQVVRIVRHVAKFEACKLL